MSLTEKEKQSLRLFLDLVMQQITAAVSPQVSLRIFQSAIDMHLLTDVFNKRIDAILDARQDDIADLATVKALLTQLKIVRAEMMVNSERARASREVLVQHGQQKVREIERIIDYNKTSAKETFAALRQITEKKEQHDDIEQYILHADKQIVSEVPVETAIDIFIVLTNMELSHQQYEETLGILLSKSPPESGVEAMKTTLQEMGTLRRVMEEDSIHGLEVRDRVCDYFAERIDTLIELQSERQQRVLHERMLQEKEEEAEFERMKQEMLQEEHERKLDERRKKREEEREHQRELHRELQKKHEQMIEERKEAKQKREDQMVEMRERLQHKYEKEMEARKSEKEQGKEQMRMMQEERQKRYEVELEERRREKEKEQLQMERLREDKQREYEDRHKKFEQEKVFQKLKSKADSLKKKLAQEQQYHDRQSKKQLEEAKRRQRVLLLQQERKRQEQDRMIKKVDPTGGAGGSGSDDGEPLTPSV
jgi:hypothetical protein